MAVVRPKFKIHASLHFSTTRFVLKVPQSLRSHSYLPKMLWYSLKYLCGRWKALSVNSYLTPGRVG